MVNDIQCSLRETDVEKILAEGVFRKKLSGTQKETKIYKKEFILISMKFFNKKILGCSIYFL